MDLQEKISLSNSIVEHLYDAIKDTVFPYYNVVSYLKKHKYDWNDPKLVKLATKLKSKQDYLIRVLKDYGCKESEETILNSLHRYINDPKDKEFNKIIDNAIDKKKKSLKLNQYYPTKPYKMTNAKLNKMSRGI